MVALKDDSLKRKLRFILVNIIISVCLIFLTINGYILPIFEGDKTNIVILMGAVFLFGFILCYRTLNIFWRESAKIGKEQLHSTVYAQAFIKGVQERNGKNVGLFVKSFEIELAQKQVWVRFIMNILTVAGLVGTVIGFIMALSGVSVSSAGELDSLTPMVAQLIGGMGVALYTTLVGATLYVWARLNYRFLTSETAQFFWMMLRLASEDSTEGEK